MTPACSLIITKTRELLLATPDEVLSRLHRAQLNAAGQSRSPIVRETMSAILEHLENLTPSQVAEEFRNTVEGIINIGDERIMMEHCKFVTQGILALSNSVQ